MDRLGKWGRLVALVNIIVWTSSPVMSLSNPERFHPQSSLEVLADGLLVLQSIESVDLEKLPDLRSETFNTFLSLHVQIPSPDDNTHLHGILDGCCGSGGLVCDVGLILRSTIVPQSSVTQIHGLRAVHNLASLALSPLYHPPKP